VEGNDLFTVRRDTGEVVVSRSLMSVQHNQQLQLVVEARDRGTLPLPMTEVSLASNLPELLVVLELECCSDRLHARLNIVYVSV